jgi:hypothetical protein
VITKRQGRQRLEIPENAALCSPDVHRVAGLTLLATAMLLATGLVRQAAHEGPQPARADPLVAPSSTSPSAPARTNPAMVKKADIEVARSYARSRQGTVAFAVLEKNARSRRPRGLRRTQRFPSASVSKAMLLIAYLRSAGSRTLIDTERAVLRPMIVVSDNDAADTVYARVGGSGLRAVAVAANMRKFTELGYWANAQITAADQARLFLRIDRLVPVRHRRFARKLLSSIVGEQRWGIPAAARRHRLKAFFKGGWRAGIVHQVALLQHKRNGRRVALAVLTSGAPSIGYSEETIEGIAARLLRSVR